MATTRIMHRGFLKAFSLTLLGIMALSLAAPPAEAQGWYRRGGGFYGRGVVVGRPGFFGFNRGFRGYGGPGFGYGPMIYSRGYYGYGVPIVPYVGVGGFGGYGGYGGYGPIYAAPIF